MLMFSRSTGAVIQNKIPNAIQISNIFDKPKCYPIGTCVFVSLYVRKSHEFIQHTYTIFTHTTVISLFLLAC